MAETLRANDGSARGAEHGKEGVTLRDPLHIHMLVAQNDDPELLEWLGNANQEGGSFISSIARAALVADTWNYALMRPLILALREKYPAYEPSDAVKQEIRERGK